MDTLKIFDNLIRVGFSPKQARAVAKSIAGMVADRAATKADVVLLKSHLIEFETQIIKWIFVSSLIIIGVVFVGALEILSRLPNPL